MEEARKIKFKVSVFSKIGSLVDKFTVEADTKEVAHYLARAQLRAQGIFEDVNYKIT